MRLLFRVLVFLMIIYSCSSGDRTPAGILSKEKMELVMWDMLQADEFLRDYVLTRDTTLNDTTESIRIYEKVFQLNKTSREEFNKSFDYYTQRPAVMKVILDSLNAKAQQSPVVRTNRPIDRIDSSAIRKIRRVDEPQ